MPPRKPVPEPWRTRLVEVTERLRATREERELTIVEALRAGGSIREIADLVGMNHRQVLEIGHAHGWPPDDEQDARRQRRADAKVDREAFTERMAHLDQQQALEGLRAQRRPARVRGAQGAGGGASWTAPTTTTRSRALPSGPGPTRGDL